MAHITTVLFIAFVLASSGATAAATPGQKAPNFTGRNIDGTPVELSSYLGKYVVLEWVNPLCPFVAKHYNSGNMQSLQSEFRDKDVVWLSVKTQAPGGNHYADAKKMKQWLSLMEANPTTLVMDTSTEIGKLYGARTTPHMFVINPKGKIIYTGAIDDKRSVSTDDVADATNYVRLALDQAMSGKDVTTPSTNPYGCAVKYN